MIIQTVAGLAGSNSLVGLVTGSLGGLFLQTYASTVATANGGLNEPIRFQIFASQALKGAVIGAIAMMATGFVLQERAQGD